MLSVLIPAFEESPDELVTSLKEQIDSAALPVEVLVLDDGSHEPLSCPSHLEGAAPQVRYLRSPTNEGRLASRFKLARQAKFDHLLFLDADVQLTNNLFLQQYLQALPEIDVVNGGTAYPEDPPPCSHRLHWVYGRKRERAQRSGKGLATNNLLIRRSLFLSLTEVPWPRYGHEDTYLGVQLLSKGIAWSWKNNPVLHPRLDTSAVFLKKSEDAVHSIFHLVEAEGEEATLRNIKIWRIYRRLKKAGLVSPFAFLVAPLVPLVRKNLLSCNPSLPLFDIYRLHFLHRLVQRGEQRPVNEG